MSDKSICSRATTKYWKKLFFNFTDMSLYNSYVLYKLNSDIPMSRKDFLVSIVDSLAENEVQERPVVEPGDDGAGHTITHLTEQLSRFCDVCAKNGQKSRSRYWCPGCNTGVNRECFHMLEHF